MGSIYEMLNKHCVYFIESWKHSGLDPTWFGLEGTSKAI